MESESAAETDWERRVVGRSLQDARRRSIDRGARFVRAAATVLDRNDGASLTVQEVADEAGQSLRTLYQYFESKDDLLLAVFEEAMRTYARLVQGAIADVDDPLERLAGGIVASIRMLELYRKAGRDRGLARLRLQLSSAEPALIARSQEPLFTLYRELVDDLSPRLVPDFAVDTAVYFLAALRTELTLSMTLGNDFGGELPDAIDLSCFCLSGLGLARSREWHVDVESRLRLDGAGGRSILRTLNG
jgi:AcrR family transcriptional regulator